MVQVVDRSLDILEQLTSAADDLSVSELRESLDLPAGTVHRLLAVLVKRGYAVQNARTRRYGPGPRLLAISAQALANERFSLPRIVRPHLQSLTASTGETSNLVVLQGVDGVYLDQVAGRHLVRMFTEIGQRAPLYCTGAGKAILSGFSDTQLDAYLAGVTLDPWTATTIVDRNRLRAGIEQSRERGYATDDEEREIGVRCVAAPIFDGTGQCSSAISISGPSVRMTYDMLEHVGPLVREAAEHCSRQLGYRRE
jgi:IclR family transcriptional regulator, acetate operon repressor